MWCEGHAGALLTALTPVGGVGLKNSSQQDFSVARKRGGVAVRRLQNHGYDPREGPCNMDRYQSTIRRKIRFTGIGLHSAKLVTCEIAPAMANTGIVFQRTDLLNAEPIAGVVANIASTELCTKIGRGDNTVATIEHLMAAFAGLGIDNAVVRLDAPELPILDGSAAPFVDRLLAAGIVKVDGFRKMLVVKQSFEIRDGQKLMRVDPADRLAFSAKIAYTSGAIGEQALDMIFSRTAFLKLAESRTFCHIDEVQAMRAHGLALGGSLDNAIVVDDESVLNPGGLRADDEFVRHKLLDCIGDLALLGAPLVGRVTIEKAGHAMHAKFMRELLARKSELLATVEIGQFRDKRLQGMAQEGATAMAAAALIYG